MKKRGSKQRASNFICATCGLDMLDAGDGNRERPGIWRDGAPVFHCWGRSHAFGARYQGEPHHALWLYAPCWHCRAELGCGLCSGMPRELLCTGNHGAIGPVWGTKTALLTHGPLVKYPQLPEHYPAPWVEAYRRTATAKNQMPEEARDDPFAWLMRQVAGIGNKITAEPEITAKTPQARKLWLPPPEWGS